MYKIQRRTDSLFSSGGSYGTFSKKGKVWSTLGGLKSHLSLLSNSYANVMKKEYKNCDIIEYVEVIGNITPVDSFMGEVNE